jgi:hypothetical protein
MSKTTIQPEGSTRRNDSTVGENRKLAKPSETPEHRTRGIGLDVLFFVLRPGCFLQEAELPVTFEFTTGGFRTIVTFERLLQRPQPGQTKGGIYGPAQKS